MLTAIKDTQRCANCLYHIYDELEDGCICVNESSRLWLSYTPHDDGCEQWAKKPYGGEL